MIVLLLNEDKAEIFMNHCKLKLLMQGQSEILPFEISEDKRSEI